MNKRQINYDSDKMVTAQRLKEAMNDAGINLTELSEKSKWNVFISDEKVNEKICVQTERKGSALTLPPMEKTCFTHGVYF